MSDTNWNYDNLKHQAQSSKEKANGAWLALVPNFHCKDLTKYFHWVEKLECDVNV